MDNATPSETRPQTFRFVPMTAAYARAILAWHYEAPYDFYNADPTTDEVDIAEVFLNPAYHYYAVLDLRDTLIAYRCFGDDARVPGGDYRADALDMGGGLRPDLTGRGLGPQVMRAAMAFAHTRFAPRAFRTTVAAWNARAIRACIKVGYQPIATFRSPTNVPFVIMLHSEAILPLSLGVDTMPDPPLTYTIRPAAPADESILWDMLFYAANMAEDGATSSAAARSHPYLAEFVAGWGGPGDLGVFAVHTVADQALGAAWLRQLSGPEKRYAAVAEGVPELAIAVVPTAIGQGIGGALLGTLLDLARGQYPAVALSVRASNRARRLYERHGFVVVDTITNRIGGQSLVMRAELR